MQKFRVALIAVISQILFSSILLAANEDRWLVPRGLVASSEIKIVWQFNLPTAKGETLDEMILCGNRLCALSSANYLTCLNKADGNVMFAGSIAPEGLPAVDLRTYKDELITMVGKNLIEIGSDFERGKTTTKIDTAVVCPVARNTSFYYIAGADKRIRALNAVDKVKKFEVAAENGSDITSVIAEDEFVVFATKAGNVIRIAADKPAKVWQFDAAGGVIGPVVHDATSLYFACRDTCIYCIDLSKGRLLWKYQTQGILNSAPQLGNKMLYQYVPDMGLAAIDKKTGKLVWQAKDCIGMLSESGDKTFAITADGHLVAMDSAKAKQLYSLYLGLPVKYATNTADARMYIGDVEGRIACLEPAK